MPVRNFQDPFSSFTRVVETQIGKSYKTVQKVADNLDALRGLTDNLDDLLAAVDAASDAQTAKTGAVTAQGLAVAAATASEGARDDAVVAKNDSETALSSFYDMFLGAAAANPTVDLNGDAVTEGQLYWNTVAKEMRVYNGSAWVAAYVSVEGYVTDSELAAAIADFATDAELASAVSNAANWNTAYGWGDHSQAGYVTTSALTTALGDYSTTTAINAALASYATNSALAAAVTNSGDWDTAYGWGDHASVGYLTAVPDNSVTLAKMEHGTQGDIVYYGTSGVPSRLGKGTADQVLTMNSAANAPEWADPASGGSGEVLVAEQEPTSDVSTITQTGLEAYRDIFVVFALEVNQYSSVFAEARAAGGTWRTFGQLGSGSFSAGSLIGELKIRNFGRNNGLKLMTCIVYNGLNTQTALDRTDAINGTPSDQINYSYLSTFTEILSEFRFRASASTFEGTTASRRSYMAVYGLGSSA